MSVSITFHGAAETVTGSCFLVKTPTCQFLIDCGMYQGPDVSIRNLEPFDFNPADVDFVLLTHTHIDHSGLLPKLVKHGFSGPIYATLHTTQLATLLMLDSAKIQENNFREAIPWKHANVVGLAYDTADAQQTISQLQVVKMNQQFNPGADVKVTYVHAAHVLGAASIEIEAADKKLVFSGDIGRKDHVIIGGFDLEHKWDPDYVVMESLYGGQYHPVRAQSVVQLLDIINDTLSHGGSVYIPAFAVQRTQELLHDLKMAKQSGALDQEVPVWLDSPLAQKATEVYRAALDHSEDSLFNFEGLRYVNAFKQSQRISRRGGQIVIAGSGMADGGRILNHLALNLENKRNSVVFVGFQAEATLGRQLTTGAKSVTIDDHTVEVKAQIHHLQGFSAHGDTSDYLAWVGRYNTPNLKQTFLIHAEPERAAALAAEFEKQQIDHPRIAKWKEEVVLA